MPPGRGRARSRSRSSVSPAERAPRPAEHARGLAAPEGPVVLAGEDLEAHVRAARDEGDGHAALVAQPVVVAARVQVGVERPAPQLRAEGGGVEGRAVGVPLRVARMRERADRILEAVPRPRLRDREQPRVVERDVDGRVAALRVTGYRAEATASECREAPVGDLHGLEHEALVVAARGVRPLGVAAERAVVAVRHHEDVGADDTAVDLGVESDAGRRHVDEPLRAAGRAVEQVQDRVAPAARHPRAVAGRGVDAEGPLLAECGGVELLAVQMTWRDTYRIDRRRETAIGVVRLSVGEGAVEPDRDPRHEQRRHERGPRALRAAGGALGWCLALLAIVGGVGWLYLIRDFHALAHGPSLSGALPLEELAERGSQPLLRMAVAWLPAGFAAGFALALTTRLRAAVVAASTGLLAVLLLFSTTAASEAVSRNETFGEHAGSALRRSGLWTALRLGGIGPTLARAVCKAG